MKIYKVSDLIQESFSNLFEVEPQEYLRFEILTKIQDYEIQLQELELLRIETDRTQAKRLLFIRISAIRRHVELLEDQL